jgi:hypothetical protein
VLYTLGSLPAVFLSRYLQKIGTPRRDLGNGLLMSSGEDLNQKGVIDYCFDVIYVTCEPFVLDSILLSSFCPAGTCQVGSGALGEWFWWLYMIVSGGI